MKTPLFPLPVGRRFLAAVCLFLLAFSLQPSAFGSQITVDVTITNAPAYGNTFTLNGDLRAWVTNTPVARQAQVSTNGPSACATNFFNSIATTPFSNGVMVLQPSSNVVRLVGPASLAMTASLPDTSWGYFTATTNTSFAMTGLRLPLASEPSAAVRTNLASLLVQGIGDYSTNRFPLGVLPTGTITNAQEQLDAVTGRVGTLEGQTNLWNGAVTNAGSGLVLSGRDLAVDWAMNKLTNDTLYTSLADFGLTNAAVAGRLGTLEGQTQTWNTAALSVTNATDAAGLTISITDRSLAAALDWTPINATNDARYVSLGAFAATNSAAAPVLGFAITNLVCNVPGFTRSTANQTSTLTTNATWYGYLTNLLSSAFPSANGGTATNLTTAGLTNLGSLVSLGGNISLLTNGSLSTVTINGAGTTINSPITAPNASSTAASAVANVSTLDGRYKDVRRYIAPQLTSSGHRTPHPVLESTGLTMYQQDNARNYALRMNGAQSGVQVGIPSSWPTNGSIIVRSSWLSRGWVDGSNYVFKQSFSSLPDGGMYGVISTVYVTNTFSGTTNMAWLSTVTNLINSTSPIYNDRFIYLQDWANTTTNNQYLLWVELELLRQ